MSTNNEELQRQLIFERDSHKLTLAFLDAADNRNRELKRRNKILVWALRVSWAIFILTCLYFLI